MSDPIVILDNGAYTAKVGLSTESAKVVPNCIMKAKSERRRPFLGNQIEECRDASGLYYILPFQKGYIVNWDTQKTVWDYIFSKECCPVDLTQCSVVITEPLFNFQSNQEALTEIFFEEYEVSKLMRINPSSLSCYKYRKEVPNSKCCIVVDSGYSFTHIIPYVLGMKVKAAIRRIDVGGKLLTNHLKEILSYRQLNVMDETYVVNQVKEDSCYVSQNFYEDIEKAKLKLDSNPIVKDYILPDFTTIKRGYLTEAKSHDEQNQKLRLNNERFSIPEILFHPSDIGINQIGVPEAIMESLKACDPETWPHLLENIILTGGNTKFSGFRDRISKELRSLAPWEYEVNVVSAEDPITYAYQGGQLLTKDEEFSNLLVSREDYEEQGFAVCFEKFDI